MTVMKLGIFRTGRPARPPGVDRELWKAVLRGARTRYDGPTEDEPIFVAPRLAELLAELTRLHHQDPRLAEARRAFDTGRLDAQLATRHEEDVGTRTAFRIQVGRAARHRPEDPDTFHLRADGARANLELADARRQHEKADGLEGGRNLELQAATVELLDRMLVVARAAMPRLHEYVAHLNVLRVRAGRDPLPNLPPGLPERLVLDAGRSVGDPAPRP